MTDVMDDRDDGPGGPRREMDTLYRLGRTFERVVCLHERCCPARRLLAQRGAPTRLPFADRAIPEGTLVEIVERMSVEMLSVQEAAEQYDYPVELLERELADYRGRYRRELRRRADPDQRWARG